LKACGNWKMAWAQLMNGTWAHIVNGKGKGKGKGKDKGNNEPSNKDKVKCTTFGCRGKATIGPAPPKECKFCDTHFVYPRGTKNITSRHEATSQTPPRSRDQTPERKEKGQEKERSSKADAMFEQLIGRGFEQSEAIKFLEEAGLKYKPKNVSASIEVSVTNLRKAQRDIVNLKKMINDQREKHERKLSEAEECEVKARELYQQLEVAQKEEEEHVKATSSTLGWSKVALQRAGELSKEHETIMTGIEEVVDIDEIPQDKKDGIFRLLLDMYTATQITIERAKVDANASMPLPPGSDMDQDEENPLGLDTSAEFPWQPAAATEAAASAGGHTKTGTVLASQAFEATLTEAAGKRQKCREKFAKGVSPRSSPKPKAQSAADPPSLDNDI
jgi:hypothetical protein